MTIPRQQVYNTWPKWSPADRFVFLMSGSTITGLLGAPEVYAGSTKVLATKGSGKTPAVYAGVTSAVAFMGPKRRQPPVFYFSSMMAADVEALATDSSLSAHTASISTCMERSQARAPRYGACCRRQR